MNCARTPGDCHHVFVVPQPHAVHSAALAESAEEQPTVQDVGSHGSSFGQVSQDALTAASHASTAEGHVRDVVGVHADAVSGHDEELGRWYQDIRICVP